MSPEPPPTGSSAPLVPSPGANAPPTSDSHASESPTTAERQPSFDVKRSSRDSVAHSGSFIRWVDQYYKLILAISASLGLLYGVTDYRNKKAERAEKAAAALLEKAEKAERAAAALAEKRAYRIEAKNRAVSELSSPDTFRRANAIDTLGYLVGKDSSLLEGVYLKMLSFIADRTPESATAQCGTAASFRKAARNQSALDVKKALEFLRIFGGASSTLRKSDSVVSLTRKNLAYANLVGADLRGVVLEYACLDSSTLDGASVGGASFSHAFLRNANLRKLRGSRVVFDNAHLNSARFSRGTLIRASFTDADLTHAWFENAILDTVNVDHAKLSWSYWRAARLIGSEHWGEVDSTLVAGVMLHRTVGISSAQLARLHRLGACVDSIGLDEWDIRRTTPSARDTSCGKARPSPLR